MASNDISDLLIDKDLGPVSAYAMAVEAGYTGTEEQFAEDLANAGQNVQAVTEAAQQATAAASRAADAAATASAAYNTDLLAVTFDQTKSYAKGQHVIYSGKYYVLPNGHDANVTWANTTKTEEKVGNEISDLKSAFKDTQVLLTGTWTDGKYVAGANVEIANQYYSIGEYNVSNVRGKVYMSTYGASQVGWVLLDSNDAVIERSLFTNSTGIDYNFTRLVDTKTNGVKLRVSCATAYKDKQVVCFVVMDNNFTPITADITTVFDNVRRNSIYNVEASNTTVNTNKVPYDNFHGSIITTGGTDASQQQFALSYDRRLFYRRKFNSWSAWAEIAIGTPIAASASTDFNTQTNPFIYCGVGGLTVATNHVPYDSFNGCVYNIDYGGNFGSQIAIANNGVMYYRYKYSTWSGWFSVPAGERVERLENDYCILSEFDNIFCAGDSLTWGAVYTGSGSSDFRAAKKPYNAILQRLTGATVLRNAQPGIDSIGYVSKLSSIEEKTNQLVIIYLGTNGGLTDTLDTDAPGTDKTNYNTSTETGAFAYIVKHCLDVNAKVLLVTIYAGGGSNGVATTNTVIGKMAEKFKVAVVENESLPQKYHIWPNGQGYDYTHLNDFGYAAFAEYLIRQVNAMDNTMLARILPDA